MTFTTAAGAYCTACRQLRSVDDLILVTPAHGAPYCVCRATVDWYCFRRSVGSRERERIEPLADYLARQEVSA